MKTFTTLALALFVSFIVPAWADIPAPKPVSITVSNVAAFPKYKFLYRTDERQETRPISDGQPFSALSNVELLIQNGNEPAQAWEKVKYDWRGAKIAIKVESVKQEGKTISVTSRMTGGDAKKVRP